jgi:hypothetical protein
MRLRRRLEDRIQIKIQDSKLNIRFSQASFNLLDPMVRWRAVQLSTRSLGFVPWGTLGSVMIACRCTKTLRLPHTGD